MGCGGSTGKSFEDVINKPSFRESLVVFHSLQLTRKDLKKIYGVFTTMDIDGSGTISLAELLAHLDLPRTAYTEKIFTIFDDDGSGAIDFREFVLSVWNYCTLTKINLDMFAFDLYDTDGSGELSPPEVLKLLQEIFGKEEMRTNIHAKSASAEIAKYQIRNENFDAVKFHNFMMYHQAMLFPSIQMQQALHKKVCGATFWEKHTKQREARSNGVYVSLAHFMMEEMHVSGNSSTVQAGSEAGGSGKSTPGLTATSGMAALKAQRARQHAVNKLKAQFVDPGNVTGQTIIGKGATFTESAKVRWVQSMAGVTDFFGSMKHTRKIGHNKVYATNSSTTMSASTSSGGGSTGSILSTVGFDAPVHSIPKPGAGHDAKGSSSSVVSPKGGREPEKEGVSFHRRASKDDKEVSVHRKAAKDDKEVSVHRRNKDHDDAEVSHRGGNRHHHHHHTNNRTTPSQDPHHGHAHGHGHGHSHGHAHGSAGNSVVTSPVVSPREAHHKPESISPTSQHSHGSHENKHRHSDAALHEEHKRRGSGGTGIAVTEQLKKKPTR